MRKLVPLLMALLLVLPVSVIGASAAGTPFVDVSSGAWYAGAVEYVYDEGLFNGTSPTTFSPGDPMKRAELMQARRATLKKPTREQPALPTFPLTTGVVLPSAGPFG